MPISRRQFFRGLTGQANAVQQGHTGKIAEVETYVRTYLLPYDFALTSEQTAEVLQAAVAGVDINGDGELLTYERRTRLQQIVEERVQRWRDEYLRAEEARHDGIPFVMEFLTLEASPEDLQKLRDRFQAPYPAPLEEELERQVRAWICTLPNARLADCRGETLRELIFSELRSWC
jgi:hypothetical protein